MKLNIRQPGTELTANDFSAVAERLSAWSPVMKLPRMERRQEFFGTESSAKQLRTWRQEQAQEELLMVALGLSGVAGVVAAFAAVL